MTQNEYFTFETGQATDVGCLRQINEDSYLSRQEYGLWVVADGMGGHAAGDFASQTIVHELNSIGLATSPEDLHARFIERLTRANEIILEEATSRGGKTIGATVVALLVHENHFACVWSGDSRLYLLRNGTLQQQSRDHTEVQALLDSGAIDAEEARNWPRKNVITHAIGVTETPQCDIVAGELELGDTFLLCSDGLTEHIEDVEIAAALASHAPQEACGELIRETVARGARDNVTVIAMRTLDPPAPDASDMLIDEVEPLEQIGGVT